MATFDNPVASSSPDFEPQSETAITPATTKEPSYVSPKVEEENEDVVKQREEDLKFKTENPNEPRVRAANPKVGGERF